MDVGFWGSRVGEVVRQSRNVGWMRYDCPCLLDSPRYRRVVSTGHYSMDLLHVLANLYEMISSLYYRERFWIPQGIGGSLQYFLSEV